MDAPEEAEQKEALKSLESAPVKKASTRVKAMADALPSPHKADLRSKLRDRVQMNFPTTPRFIKEQFEVEAAKRNMTHIEFLYFCLRERGGLEIPPYDQMNLRRTEWGETFNMENFRISITYVVVGGNDNISKKYCFL